MSMSLREKALSTSIGCDRYCAGVVIEIDKKRRVKMVFIRPAYDLLPKAQPKKNMVSSPISDDHEVPTKRKNYMAVRKQNK